MLDTRRCGRAEAPQTSHHVVVGKLLRLASDATLSVGRDRSMSASSFRIMRPGALFLVALIIAAGGWPLYHPPDLEGTFQFGEEHARAHAYIALPGRSPTATAATRAPLLPSFLTAITAPAISPRLLVSLRNGVRGRLVRRQAALHGVQPAAVQGRPGPGTLPGRHTCTSHTSRPRPRPFLSRARRGAPQSKKIMFNKVDPTHAFGKETVKDLAAETGTGPHALLRFSAAAWRARPALDCATQLRRLSPSASSRWQADTFVLGVQW